PTRRTRACTWAISARRPTRPSASTRSWSAPAERRGLSAIDEHGLALAALFAQGSPLARAGGADEVRQPVHRRALPIAGADQLLELPHRAQERHRLSAGARVVPGGL